MRVRNADAFAVIHALAGAPSNATPDVFRTTINRAISRLVEEFHFKSAALVGLALEDWSIERVFTTQGHGAAIRLAQDFVLDLRGVQRPSLEAVFLRGVDHDTSLCQERYIQLKRSRKAVASIVRLHDRLTVMLVVECPAGHRNAMVDSRILRVATELLALAIEKNTRSIELEELTRRLEEAQRAQLAGGIAHELNNNLTAIMGYAEMAAEAVAPDSPTHGYVEEILDAGKKAKLAIDRILMSDGIRKNAPTPFDAVDATAAILPALRISLDASVGLHVDLPDAELAMDGNPIEFQQLLIKFCNDAGEAVGRGGQLRLVVEAVEQPGDRFLFQSQWHPRKYVRISIIDMSGQGTWPPFAMRATQVAMHVCSTLEKGTRLELFFPCVDKQATPIKTGFAASSNHLGKGELVAVVDPDGTSRSVWEERVAALGYEPMGFPEISTLVDWCLSSRSEPDVILFHGPTAVPSEMEASLSAGVAWMYISHGVAGFPREPGVSDQPSKFGKLVNSDGFETAIHMRPVPLPEARLD